MAIVFFYVPTLLLLAAMILLVFKGITTKKFKDLWNKIINEEEPSYILFITMYIMIAIINYIFFLMELVGVLLWSLTGELVGAGVTVSKVIHILISCILPGIVAIFIARSVSNVEAHSKEMPKHLKRAMYFFTFGVGWCISRKRCCDRLVQETLVAMNFLVFVAILAWCVIPTVVLAFADPVETISVVSLAVCLFLLIAIAMSMFILFADKSKASITLVALVVILIGCVVISLIVLYLYIIEKGASTGGVSGAIAAFIPTTITAVALWFLKRSLKKYQQNAQSISDMQNKADNP